MLFVSGFLLGSKLRLHRYIVTHMRLLATAFPTRLSAIYQAFPLGFFINDGMALQWDSILQTTDEVRNRAENQHPSKHTSPSLVEMQHSALVSQLSSKIRRRPTPQYRYEILLCFGRVCHQVVTIEMDSRCSLTMWRGSAGRRPISRWCCSIRSQSLPQVIRLAVSWFLLSS